MIFQNYNPNVIEFQCRKLHECQLKQSNSKDNRYVPRDQATISWPDGYEKQFRLHCPRCNLLIAYEMTERRKNGQYTYIVEGSLTENQGVIPHESILDD
ncbi:6565_t:CDS:2 [Entrophospora sp. SA101]|nr:6565_t:CDS:2 [Entrophospora sp. SA101]